MGAGVEVVVGVVVVVVVLDHYARNFLHILSPFYGIPEDNEDLGVWRQRVDVVSCRVPGLRLSFIPRPEIPLVVSHHSGRGAVPLNPKRISRSP